MGSRLIEVELRVRDLDRSLRFYRELLGLPVGEPETHGEEDVRHAHATWGSWGQDGFLLFNIYPAGSAEPTRARIGFEVDGLDAIHARMAGEGAEVVHPPERKPWGRTAAYRDPDGNVVALTERPRR